MKLTDFKALTFDCYGTLIDWESGMIDGLKPLTERAARSLSRNDILEAHARHEASQQKWTPGNATATSCRSFTSDLRRSGVSSSLLRNAWRMAKA